MLCPQLTRQLRRNVFFCHLILKATLLLYDLALIVGEANIAFLSNHQSNAADRLACRF